MKKIFLFAALACTVFASCQKEAPVASVQNDGQQEITFTALQGALTKGVLGTGAFADDRKIRVAGVMKTADVQYVDFLEPATFEKDETNSYWVANPKVYYPIGGTNNDFRFLAYSETTPATGTEETFARWYGSNEVELQVNDCAENEIVYSGFKGDKNNTSGASAIFKRTQALVTVQISAKYDEHNLVINKIGFKDVKTSGTLLLKYDATASSAPFAKAQWVFNAGCNCACAEMEGRKLNETTPLTVDPNKEVDFIDVTPTSEANALGYKLTTAGFQLDRLFPAQKLETKKMVINYTLGGNTYDVELELSNAKIVPESGDSTDSGVVTWAAGSRYVYKITVNVKEILINPTVLDAWSVTIIQGTYDPDTAA